MSSSRTDDASPCERKNITDGAKKALHTSWVNWASQKITQYLPFYKTNINTINHISSGMRGNLSNARSLANRHQTMLSLFKQSRGILCIIRYHRKPELETNARLPRRAWEKVSWAFCWTRFVCFFYDTSLFVFAPPYLHLLCASFAGGQRQQLIRIIFYCSRVSKESLDCMNFSWNMIQDLRESLH